MSLKIGKYTFESRLFLGTGKFSSNEKMAEAVKASRSELVTVALKRVHLASEDGSAFQGSDDQMLSALDIPRVKLLPNTSGVRDAKQAVFAAELAREALETDLIKLEIHPDPRYLMPDPVETLIATEELAKKGFTVLPYISADPVICLKLEEAGAAAVMPLGAPIGTNKGITTREMIKIIVEQASLPVVIDAGLGAPSHAAEAFELGVDAILVNTAIAIAPDPAAMAEAFYHASIAGRKAYEVTAGNFRSSDRAQASSPLTAFLDS